MPHHDEHFDGHDGRRLFGQSWLGDEPSTAALVVVHGINEHGGRYAQLAGELNVHGYAVYTMDLRGHGRSDGPRVRIRSFDEFTADVEVLIARVRRREPGKPIFLFGHSMGAAVVTLLAITREPDVRGMVLSAPPFVVGGHVFPLLRYLAPVFSRLLPYLRFPQMGAKYLSRNKQAVAEFKADPLVHHGRFPIRTGAEILRVGSFIVANMESLRLPFLTLHGTADKVTDAEGSRLLIARAGSPDKTLKLYDGGYHEMLSEPERDQVVADLLEWLDARRK